MTGGGQNAVLEWEVVVVHPPCLSNAFQKTTPEKRMRGTLACCLSGVFAVVFFFYYQLAAQLRMAFAFVWEKAEWPLVAEVAEIRFPFPPVSPSSSPESS
jgi:hypothetical protein